MKKILILITFLLVSCSSESTDLENNDVENENSIFSEEIIDIKVAENQPNY